MIRLYVVVFLLSFQNIITAQLLPNPELEDELLHSIWNASWVQVPGVSNHEYGVFFFRNELALDIVPDNYIIHVTADNRYKFFVNGEWIGLGPARSDPENWMFDTYDIAPFLKQGKNIIAAIVWNFGDYNPWAQFSVYSGFLVHGNDTQSEKLNTPGSWKCLHNQAYEPLDVNEMSLGTFIIVGAGEQVNGSDYPWDWQNPEYNDSDWEVPISKNPGLPKGVGTDLMHGLVPRTIPAMELRRIAPPSLLRINTQKVEYKELHNYEIAANSKVTVLLDQKELVTAYPEVHLSGGRGANIRISYAEALFDENGKKQHRDSVENMYFKGISDLYIADGANRIYTTLWFRTFRYIQLEIETADSPLIIDSLSSLFTAYPFKATAYFECNDKEIASIWEVAWRTSRLCANELFYDCPYYEQMQYVGDTRIQALISLYMTGDDRLMKKAINDYYHSMIPEGLTQSRYPSSVKQVIPTFSLYWISMMHDYLWNRNDYMYIANYLVSIQHVLQWFEDRIDKETGMLSGLEYWPFVDWTAEWPWDNTKRIGGVPPGAQDGNSSIITLQYAMTLDQAADIFSFYGFSDLAQSYLDAADKLIDATKKHCWDEERQIFADTPDKQSFSQHANTFAVLTNAIPENDQALFMEGIIRNDSLVQASLYFRFYLHQAAIASGLGNKYISYLNPWRKMVNYGLTTFPEIPDLQNTRSDCHAWSSSPLYELLATTAGFRPAAPGFESIIIEPHPGELQWIKAGMPHKKGFISLDLSFDEKGGVKGTLSLPQGLSGIFSWDGQTLDLKPGKQKVALKSMDSRFNLR
ncbi:alpha-L-rhamnosidase [Bacteroidota bacterium]